ncbi:uncharacterized protein LOC116109392 [Pistacia vera]|uniref:uncharacterized protein LOC116109392 n=1 Tax=Pistacia vera TaxID=55513 RepID=UPI001263B496|nr:uncharacterized protein LOC116109392 [Pistacia vera]
MDFNTWKKKMKALLSHNKVGIALEKDETKWPEEKTKKKAEIDEEAYNLIIMNLSDNVLRKVDGALFSYKMNASKSLEENLDEFLKMILVLKGTDQELGNSSLAMILLNSLPDEYLVVKNVLQKQKQNSTESNLASSSNSIEITEALNVSSSEVANEWVLDSGCSFHMSPNKTWFQNLITGEPEIVFMGNNNSCRVQGIGNITLRLKSGRLIMLTRVRYIPELKRNLISLGTLDEAGCSYRAANGCITVYKNDQILFEGVKRHGLYILCGQHHQLNVNSAFISTNISIAEKWHLRMGHIGQTGMSYLKQQGVTNINAGTSSHHVETPQQIDSTQFKVESTRQQELETNTDEPEYEPEHTTTNTELDGEDENEENIDNAQQMIWHSTN